MKKLSYKLYFLILILSISCKEQPKETTSPIDEQEQVQAQLDHGKYMVDVLGCTDCHTPKKMTAQGPVHDMDRFLMGFDASQPLPPVPDNVPMGPWVLFAGDLTAAVGPWGTSYAANLTPHETGIGNWSLQQFTKALRDGKYKGLETARPIMPPMPKHYAYLSDEDIEAIFNYLKTIPAKENVVPAYRPPSS
ncbi:diheme cytochrome c-553 [Euzebyella marina]|uniref:Diheme cytochrome c-553 n=1 Tax=Euzebyella marina TaxID=1761453 RepID=A0A3G2L3M4_9FLAO|nr:c-type cytochrome [Euzebyella marina]AYN66880.1 diheme cytochrome c-553 [Euzebyella marina]